MILDGMLSMGEYNIFYEYVIILIWLLSRDLLFELHTFFHSYRLDNSLTVTTSNETKAKNWMKYLKQIYRPYMISHGKVIFNATCLVLRFVYCVTESLGYPEDFKPVLQLCST